MKKKLDWLGEMQAAVGCVLAALATAGVVSTAAVLSGAGVEVELPATAAELPPGVSVDPDGAVDAVVDQPDAAERAASVLTHLPTYVVVLVLFALLFRLVRQARRHDPFHPATVRRLRRLGLVAGAGGPLAAAVEMVATLNLTDRVTGGLAATATLDVTATGLWLVAGCGFLAVAEVVNRGTAMRAELDTLV